MNDPVAMCREGVFQSIKGDYNSCIQRPLNWESCGSALQTITYYVQFGIVLRRIGERKFIYLEEAAIGGHPYLDTISDTTRRNMTLVREQLDIGLSPPSSETMSIKALMAA